MDYAENTFLKELVSSMEEMWHVCVRVCLVAQSCLFAIHRGPYKIATTYKRKVMNSY